MTTTTRASSKGAAKPRRVTAKAAPGAPLRVRAHTVYGTASRGTVRERATVPRIPTGLFRPWTGGPEVVRVEFDHGPELWLPARMPRRIQREDVYEAAVADAPSFFRELLARDPLERARVLARVARSVGCYGMYGVGGEASEGAPVVAIEDRAPRFYAMLRRLARDEAVDVALALLEGWVATEPRVDLRREHSIAPGASDYDEKLTYRADRFKVEDLVDLHLSALGLLLCADEPPFALGPEAAARLASLVERLEPMRHNMGCNEFCNLALFRAWLAAPVARVVRWWTIPQRNTRPAAEFGLPGDVPVVVP